VYRVPGVSAPDGRVVSTVLDAGSPARWGTATLEPGPGTDGLSLETRTGNTRAPGDSWGEWQEVRLSETSGPVTSAAARFLQWRLTVGTAATPVAAVRVAYLPANRSPRIASVAVSALGARLERTGDHASFGGVAQQLPGGVRIEIQSNNGVPPMTAGAEESSWARRYRAVSWTAKDPDADPLRYELALRQPDETTWHTLEKDLKASPWVWDSATVPDGWYEIRLMASDHVSNPRSQTLTAGRVAQAFLVDNTNPRIVDLTRTDSGISGTAEDVLSSIRMIEYALDGASWERVFPEDGIPDSRREPFAVALDTLDPGDHVILVRAVDEGGNLGTGRLGFTVAP